MRKLIGWLVCLQGWKGCPWWHKDWKASAEMKRKREPGREAKDVMNNLRVDEKQRAEVSTPAVLDASSAESSMDGIQINELKELDTLSIETMHHIYEMIVIHPETAEVRVRGGELFPGATLAFVSGASFHSAFLQVHGVYIGCNVELSVNSRRIRTSPVRSIRLLPETHCEI